MLALVVGGGSLRAQAWTSDQVHSTVMYTIRHAVTPMPGLFKKFTVDMTWDAANLANCNIDATLDAASVQMSVDNLSKHLQGADYFDVANHPTWTFKSTSIVADKKGKPKGACFIANGKLTVRGVTKDVAIPFEFKGTKESRFGVKAGFVAEFTIHRLDYGVGQGDAANTEFVGNEVKVNVMLEMNQKK